MPTTHWGAVSELAARQHGVVTRAQAAELGVLEPHVATMLDRGLVVAEGTRILRVCGAPVTWRQTVMAACLATDGVACMRTAAALHRLDGAAEAHIEVMVVRRSRHRRVDVTVRSARDLAPEDVVLVDGIPTTTIARTLCDIGAVEGDDMVERLLDDALRRGCSERWIRSTLDRLHRPGPSGTGALVRVLARSDRTGVVPGSWKERVLARLLRHPELDPLVAQFEIRDANGKVVARPDLAVVDARVGIEFHSDQWHHGPRRGRRDRRRDLAAARQGWELLYLDQADFADPDAAIEAVVDVVRRRRRELSPPTGG